MAPIKPIKTAQKPDFKSKNKSAKSSKPGFLKSMWNNMTGERVLFIAGLLLFFFVLYLIIAFISYFFTGINDQSHMDLSWRELQEKRNEIQNWGSVTGALLTHTMIHKWFGISSFSILVLLTVLAFRLMRKRIFSLWKTFFHAAFWLIWLSVTLSFALNPLINDMIFFSIGGQHGEVVSNLIVSYIGFPGTILALTGLFIIYGVIVSVQTIPFIKKTLSRKSSKKTALNSKFEEIELDVEDDLLELL